MCAADEVWRLQRGSEADCVYFQRLVNDGKRITDRGTRQGLWVLAPGAGVLARCNTRNVEDVLEALARGLAAWEVLGEDARRLPSDARIEPEHRWESSYPVGGLVLERVARELDGVGPEAPRSARWNRDFAWFSAEEVAGMIPDELAVGETLALPLVVERLARFHLVDDVRGQTLPFAPAELLDVYLDGVVSALDGARVVLELSGATAAEADLHFKLGDNSWTPQQVYAHGLHSRLMGTATFDRVAGRFVEFELVALAVRHGRTQNNGRSRDDSPGKLAFHVGIAPASARLAPAFAGLYGVPWIALPAQPTWRDSPAECGLEPGH